MPDAASSCDDAARRTAGLNRLWGGIIVEELLRCGAGVFCLSPGSRCAPLTLGVAENARARNVVHFDERGAAYHALGWAKASGRPAVLVCTSGTAAANYLPAVVEASQSRVPLILLTADRPPELLDAGANQAIDQTNLFGKYARWQYALPCPDESVPPNAVLTAIDQAVFRAVCPPAGPVHLNCQFREPFVSADAWKDTQSYPKQIEAWRESGLPYTAYTKPEYGIGADTVQRILEIVCRARRGLLIIGELRMPAEREAVGRLARALNWPAFPDITSGLRLGNSGTPFVPYYDQMLLSSSVRDACKPDAVIQIGSPFVSKRLLEHLDAFPPGAYVMVADHPLRHDPIHRVTLRVQSEIACFCAALAAELDAGNEQGWAQALFMANDLVHDEVEAFLARDDSLGEPRVARLISENAPEDGVIFLGNSMPIRDMDMYGSPHGPVVRIAVNRGASGIDGNIATALGYAAALGVPVTALLGDLAALHDINSLALLSNIAAPVVLVVVNNNGGGVFSFLPVAGVGEHFERYFAAPQGLTFEHAARLFGLSYARPATSKMFVDAYGGAVRSKRHWLIEVRTDRGENLCIHRALQEVIAKRLDNGIPL